MNLKYPGNLLKPSADTHKFIPQDSKACASAMLALQARLKLLENEKTYFKDNQILLESRSYKDREKWQTRFLDEVHLNKASESLLINKLHEQEVQID